MTRAASATSRASVPWDKPVPAPGEPTTRSNPASTSASAETASLGPSRRPPGRAGEVAQKEHTRIPSISKRGRPASGQKLTEVIESTALFWGITRDPEIRAKVRAQLRRLRRDRKRRRYDPRLNPGITAKRIHEPVIAVDEIIQGSIEELEEWKAEILSGWTRLLAAADARDEAVWKRGAA